MEFDEDVAGMTEQECKDEIQRISKLFDNEKFNLNDLYNDKSLVTSLQGNNLAQFLIKKGIIDEDELNDHFYRLMVSRFREHEQVLPQVRRARLEHQAKMDAQAVSLLGPNGERLM